MADLVYVRDDGEKKQICTSVDGRLQCVDVTPKHALHLAEDLIRAVRHVSDDNS